MFTSADTGQPPGACIHSHVPTVAYDAAMNTPARTNPANLPVTSGPVPTCLPGRQGGIISLTIPESEGLAESFDIYRVAPAPGQPIKGAVIVIHEIWGLVDQICGVADRLAAQGYVVYAPDILSHGGISPEVGAELARLRESADPQEQYRLQTSMREALTVARQPEYGTWAVAALRAVVDALEAEPGVSGRIGATGFCFGGTYTLALAAADPRLRAAAPFYGSAPAPELFSHIGCPVLAFYGGQDERLMTALPDVVTAMAGAGVDFTPVVYDDAGHAFFNEANSQAYQAQAAHDSWDKLLAFFASNLAG